MIPTRTESFDARQVELAARLKALSHPARIAILQHLARRDSCICGELVQELPLSQASVSRHLKTLRTTGLITGEVDGPRSCYCLNMNVLIALSGDLQDLFSEILVSPVNDECC